MDKVCTFQKEQLVVTKEHFLSVETKNVISCVLTTSGMYGDIRELCDTKLCPMYRTWQILEANQK